MKNVWIRFISLIVLVTVCVTAFASCEETPDDKVACSAPTFSSDTIKIGASGPLTGGAAIYGQAVYNGAVMAVQEINDAGGINGIMLSFEMYDDAHDATKIAAGYASLKGKGMQVSLACVTSAPCLSWKSYAAEDSLFCITPSATSDKVTEDSTIMYQMCFSDSNQGKAAAEYFAQNYADKKIGIFYLSDDDYSKGIKEQFVANYQGDLQDLEAHTASFTSDTATDFSSQITLLSDCDVIFMPIYYSPATTFMIQAQDTTMSADTVFFGCDGFDGIDSQDGFDVTSIQQKISYLSHFNSKATTGAAGEFITEYNTHYDEASLNQFGASAYDCVYAIKKAIETAIANGNTIDGSTTMADLCTYLTDVFQSEEFKFDGVTGTNITWSADGTVNKLPIEYTVKEKN